MSETSRAEIKRLRQNGFTPRVIIIGTVLLAFTIWFNIVQFGTLGIDTWLQGERISAIVGWPFGWIFLQILISAAIGKAAGKGMGLTAQEQAVLATMLFISGDFVFVHCAFSAPLLATYATETWRSGVGSMFPSWLVPSESRAPALLQGAMVGMSSVPGELWGYIFAWALVAIVAILFEYFTVLLFRNAWIRVERLPFPMVTPVIVEINTAYANAFAGPSYEQLQSKPLLKRFSNYFWIGLALGAIASIPATINFVYPFTTQIQCWGQLYFPSFSEAFAAANLNLGLYAVVTLADLAIAFFAPMDWLLTMVFVVILFAQIILPVLLTVAGIIPPGPSWVCEWGGPFPWIYFGQFGVTFGLALWAFAYHGKGLAQGLKNALSFKKPEDNTDIPDYYAWFGFIITGILWLAIGVSLGAPVILMIAIMVWWMLSTVGVARYMGEGPTWTMSGFRWGQEDIAIGYLGKGLGIFPAGASFPPGWGKEGYATFFMTGKSNAVGWSDPEFTQNGGYVLTSHKLAEEVGVTQKSMFYANLFTLTIGVLLTFVIGWMVVYQLGLQSGMAKGAWTRGAWTGGTGFTGAPGEFNINQTTAIVSGIIVTIVLNFLRMRYPGLWINPAGFYFTWTADFMIYLPALIFKYAIFKIGGSKMYEELGVPLFAGFLVGMAGGCVFGLGLLQVRYWLTVA
jgi:hypothetical protein